MSGNARGHGVLTLILAACSMAVAVTGVVLGAETDGNAGASVPVRPAVARASTLAERAATAIKHGSVSGASLWIDPSSPAAKARAALTAQHRSADAATLAKIAARPTATWLTGDVSKSVATVQRVVSAATAAHQVPVFVTYYLPDRDCGGYSNGGAASVAAYQSWIRAVAAQLGSQPSIVIVEPDAVAMVASRSCASAAVNNHEAMLADAVSVLKRRPATSVYLDAGNSNWVSNIAALAGHLKASGLSVADGFALNVSNFRTLSDSIAYGNKISAAVGGKHFIIDTSRNGAGPLPSNSGYQGPSWCNPPGRALGTVPTTRTGQALVDAYLWVKYPGASDGSCGLGDPSPGTFWLDYALGLAQRGA